VNQSRDRTKRVDQPVAFCHDDPLSPRVLQAFYLQLIMDCKCKLIDRSQVSEQAEQQEESMLKSVNVHKTKKDTVAIQRNSQDQGMLLEAIASEARRVQQDNPLADCYKRGAPNLKECV
jgi:hypothetical protein